jgi:predicted NBD/HSP70 family sugar kinase/biotin operon repressor
MTTRVTPGSQAGLRAANQRRVVHAVQGAEEMTQADIARATGLSAATVSNIVRELREQGILVVTPTSAGRRAQVVSLSSRTGLLLGADFGHTHLRLVVGNLSHQVLAEDAIPLDVDASADDGLAAAERLADSMLEGLGAQRSSVLGLGVGLPGPIDRATGTLGSSTILPGWVGVNPVEELTRRFGLSVCVDNDANLGALAETTWGSARGHRNAVYVKIGWGVGAGVVIGGEVYRGQDGIAGELGHFTIDESGPLCRCGNRGCLETFAGGRHLADILRPARGELTTAQIVALAIEGDLACRRVISDAGRHVGVGVASLCNLLNPGRVVIGGDLAAAGALLFDSVIEGVRRYAIPAATQKLTVEPGALGERAEVLGALALAVRQWEHASEAR